MFRHNISLYFWQFPFDALNSNFVNIRPSVLINLLNFNRLALECLWDIGYNLVIYTDCLLTYWNMLIRES